MKYLVVVDMQNDFIDGALGTKDAEAIVPNVIEKIEKFISDNVSAKNDHWHIVFTMDSHREDEYFDTQEGELLPVKHCIEFTNGWDTPVLIDDIILDTKNKYGYHKYSIFEKNTFGSVKMAELIKVHNDAGWVAEEITIVGLCTDICVISNAMLLKAFAPEAKIIVDASCCAGTTPENHENALKSMRQCQIFIENWEG